MSDTHSLGFVKMLVPSKANLKEALKLGAGAAGAITVTDLMLSRLLVRNGAPLVPVKWSPLAIPVGAWLLSRLATRFGFGGAWADGMVAGGVGVGISALLARFTAPAMAASTESAAMAEESGYGAQGVQGFGLGRAFAPGLGRVGRVGRARGAALYGVGTPDMRASKMLGGATVAIEDGSLRGATVAFEDTRGFAGTLQ